MGGGVFGDVEVDDATAMVGKYDENEEHAQPSRWHREEVNGDEIRDVIGKERPPRLGGRRASLRHQPGDGAFRDLDSQLQQFAMNSRAPQTELAMAIRMTRERISAETRGRPTEGRAGKPGPILSKAPALPAENSVGRHDDE